MRTSLDGITLSKAMLSQISSIMPVPKWWINRRVERWK